MSGRLRHRAVGQALRARLAGRPADERLARPAVGQVSATRPRRARRCARRHCRGRGRMRMQLSTTIRAFWLALAGLFAAPARGAVIPEDRSDLLYHYYNGGGTTASGPALLASPGNGEPA